MGHGLTATDGMFTVRESAWHDLGVVFDDYPTREEAQSIAHPWEPLREDIYRRMPVLVQNPLNLGNANDLVPLVRLEDGTELPLPDVPLAEGTNILVAHEPVVELTKLDGFYANVRSDNGTALGVVTDKYVTVTNAELWDIAEALEKSGPDVMYETGGSLRGGAQVWVLVRLQEPLAIKGDPRGETIPYFALQNSHDGTGAFRGQATMTRIVCMNTSHVADMDARARGTEFTFKHTKNVAERIDQAKTALSGWRQAIEDWRLQQEHLITLPITDGGVQQFLENFIPRPPAHLTSDRVQQNVDDDRAKWLAAYRSVTGEGIENTAYGLVAASTEYANWVKAARTAESRFRRTFLSTDKIVSGAVTLALDAAKVDA